MGPVLELETADLDGRSVLAKLSNQQRLRAQDVEILAVGLDDVGFVDAAFLDVGASLGDFATVGRRGFRRAGGIGRNRILGRLLLGFLFDLNVVVVVAILRLRA